MEVPKPYFHQLKGSPFLRRIIPQISPASLSAKALVSHAGLGAQASFLNALGFRKLCEDRFSQFVPAMAGHRPGKILGSLALMLAGGGEQVTDIDQFLAAPVMFGAVGSDATISRFMARVKDQPEAFAYGFATMQRTLRTKVWEAAGKRSPARRATAVDPLTIDVDASLVHVHSAGMSTGSSTISGLLVGGRVNC